MIRFQATLSLQTISSYAGSFQQLQVENLNLCEVYLQLLPQPDPPSFTSKIVHLRQTDTQISNI